MNTTKQRESEKETIRFMIALYCRKKHPKEWCEKCSELYSYASKRIDSCPFMETKTFCSNCQVHCYEQTKRMQIKKIMRFAGPYMLLYHPVMALRHIYYKRKENKI